MLLWILLVVAAAFFLYLVITFNSLVRTRQMANEAWSGIDVQLKRRSIWFQFGKSSLRDALCPGRGHAAMSGARAADNDVASRASQRCSVAALRQTRCAGGELSRSQGRQQFLDLQQQLSQLETELQMAPLLQWDGPHQNVGAVLPKQSYCRAFGFGQRQYFEADGDRAVPQVSLQPGLLRVVDRPGARPTAPAPGRRCHFLCWPC